MGFYNAAPRLTGKAWQRLRDEVYRRSGGTCNVCRLPLDFDSSYHCGHIVDRAVGGLDELDNLVAMHAECNLDKPFHETREEYEIWRTNWQPLWKRFFDEWWGGLTEEKRKTLSTRSWGIKAKFPSEKKRKKAA